MKRFHLLIVLVLCFCLLCGGCSLHAAERTAADTAASETSALGSFQIEAEDADIAGPATTNPGLSVSETSIAITTASSVYTSGTSAPETVRADDTSTATTTAKSVSGTVPSTVPSTAAKPTEKTIPAASNEIRAVWISYLDFSFLSRDRSEKAFRSAAREMTRKIRDGKMNTVFLHVRPASDAFYRSSLFPYSAYISGTEGKDPGYDALQIFCAYAKEANLSVHAWINPFRVGDASKIANKAASNPAMRILTDDDPENDGRIARANGSLYYDPADRENQELILDGIRELLQNYPLGGIHIDDFYPTTDASVDRKDYDAYLADGGTDSRDAWRRAQINTLVSRMYTTVKSFGQDKIFSISPAMEIEKNRSTQYADVTRWAKYGGYCDWLIPQVYVGFEHQTHPFREIVRQWTSLPRSSSVRLLFGLAAYKSGTRDNNAGSGSAEWIENKDILSRQIRYLRESGGSTGFAMFSYAYIFGEKMSNNSISEMKSVIDML